jgi:hypothetical protein
MLDRVRTAFKCLFLLTALPFAHTQQLPDFKLPNFKRPFSVELSIVTDSLRRPLFRSHGGFLIHATITNISSQDQSITVWEPGGGCWISNNGLISTEVNTLSTSKPIRILLKPGEAHVEDNEVFWYRRTQPAVTFKLGFFPAAEARVSCNRDTIPRDQIAWSNAVTLTQ